MRPIEIMRFNLHVALAVLLHTHALAFTTTSNHIGVYTPLISKRSSTTTACDVEQTANVPLHQELASRPDIKVQESQVQQPIDEHSSVIYAARTVDDEEVCEGYIVKKLYESNAYEAHMSCDNVENVDQFIAVFHKLLVHYLSIEYELYEKERDDFSCGVRCSSQLKVLVDYDTVEKSMVNELERIGFPLPSEKSQSQSSDGLYINLEQYMPFLNEYAFKHRGTEQGNISLLVLQMMSKRRVAFDFEAYEHKVQQQDHQSIERRKSVIAHQKQVLPSSAIDQVMNVVDEIKSRKFLSMNPDSVDGLPSLHLNLISNGKPMFDEADIVNDSDSTEDTFSQCISKMVDILHPHLYDDLLPSVRKLTNSSTIEISDVFIRNYGKMDEDESNNRYGLSSHYDVTAYATFVITLDSTACTGRNGLYSILPTNLGDATGHAALRKFFPLDKGDGVVHTYNVLHGVDVDPELNQVRTSLIVWFVDTGKANDESDQDSANRPPWLANPTDDVDEFVAGLIPVTESTVEEDGNMMLRSASKGNIFAMTSLAQMCDDGLVPESQYNVILKELAKQDGYNPFLQIHQTDGKMSCERLSSALWYQAGIYGGHRSAQASLADELMHQYMSTKDKLLNSTEQEDILLSASVLFAMSLTQGYDCKETLGRIMDIECGRLASAGIDIPLSFASPVVQVLLMFMEDR